MEMLGKFDLLGEEEPDILFLMPDEVDEVMRTFNIEPLEDLSGEPSTEGHASSIADMQEVNNNLQVAAMDNIPPPETPAPPQRFSNVSEEQLQNFEGLYQSKSTKKNTIWGMKILQDWHLDVFGTNLDMENIPPEDLSEKLKKFYCEARPKRKQATAGSNEFYHKNTLKNIRAAINRHLQDIGRHIDIVQDKAFKSSNRVLDGFMKEMTRTGNSKPTKHKEVIDALDLQKIANYFQSSAATNPIVLRQCVWYFLSFHFVSRGLEFHHQLQPNSFIFCTGDDGIEYATLSHETQQKNFQGGLNCDESHRDKRMYATGDDNCPIKMLRLLLQKTSPDAVSLFNCCTPDAVKLSEHTNIWYSNQPLKKRSFSGFMADISKYAKCSKTYTAHCLRATAIQGMSDAGYEARHIMYMSGHRNEASIRSYSRNPSAIQKKALSTTLSAVATGDEAAAVVPFCPSVDTPQPSNPTTVSASVTQPGQQPVMLSNSSTSSGLLNNSSFSSCTFNIVMRN